MTERSECSLDRAYDRGFQAFNDQLSRLSNPYRAANHRREYDAGWRFAAARAEDAR